MAPAFWWHFIRTAFYLLFLKISLFFVFILYFNDRRKKVLSILCWSGRRIKNGKVEIGARQEKTHNAYERGFTVNRCKHAHLGCLVLMLAEGQVCLLWD
jgi:hypothetical protein